MFPNGQIGGLHLSDIILDVERYKKGWKGGLPETPCGMGSRVSETVLQREWIPKMIRKYKIKTIADIGAGDLNWIQHMKMPKALEYKAYDLVPRHPDVMSFNLLEEIPPKVDLIFCLWVLNHFTYEHCLIALENLKASGSKYMMMTHRPIWAHEQPPELNMEALETLIIREDKQDQIKLVLLNED